MPERSREPHNSLLMRFRWGTVVAFLALEGLFLALGCWQVDRLAWKTDLIAQQERWVCDRHPSPPLTPAMIDAAAQTRPASATKTVAKVQLKGGTWAAPWLMLTPRIWQGRAGVEVLAPCVFPGDRVVWVNLGWAEKPFPFPLPAAALQDLMRHAHLDGVLRIPAAPRWFVPANVPERQEWLSCDPASMTRHSLGLSGPSAYVERLGDDWLLGGVRVHAVALRPLTNDHRGYALTWFGLALALALWVGIPWLRARYIHRRPCV